MTLFELCALVITLVALFGYVNCRLLHLPDTIGILAIALLCSLAAAGIGLFHPQVARWAQTAVAHIDFTALVFHGLIAVPIVLVARAGSVALPIGLLRVWRPFEPGIVRIMTWGGLRGAISIALALSLPHGAIRDIIVSATYFVAVFSILIQALTLPLLTRRWFRHSDSSRAAINGERSIIPKSGADNG